MSPPRRRALETRLPGMMRANLVGANIRRARQAHVPPLSAEECCARLRQRWGLELTVQTLSKIELGKRAVYDYEVKYFGDVLSVSLEELFAVEL
jgi:hypothetical protein